MARQFLPIITLTETVTAYVASRLLDTCGAGVAPLLLNPQLQTATAVSADTSAPTSRSGR